MFYNTQDGECHFCCVVLLSVILLTVILLTVILLTVILLTVAAPRGGP
jgi:hypothetical protein